MSSLDLHPEELLDKVARGEASPEEAARVEAHLAECATCRFERRVRADFEAMSADGGDVDDLVARALMGAATTPAPVPVRRRRVSGLLVAAVVLMGFGSFAAVARLTGWIGPKPEPTTPAPTQEATPPPPRKHPAVRPAPAPVVNEPVVEAPLPPPEPRRHRPAPSPAGEGGGEGQRAARPLSETPPLPAPAVEDAATVFRSAQQARLSGDPASAVREFRAVVARFPQSHEARLANAELGRLLLARGEPQSALDALDAYLESGDVLLREDVLAERAEALEAVGRRDDAKRAWQRVLDEAPTGPHAERAKSRL